MYLDNTVVAQYLISSGKAATPTAIAEGRIYAKYPVQTMTGTINGEYYYVPNIKWVSYFYGGEAFHGTYWHDNFGHPMSHGCINMTEADAKVLYDFAPIGTKVIVHA
jgi:lipoprotein-anchoring transpeptidase ErfK/SrfK